MRTSLWDVLRDRASRRIGLVAGLAYVVAYLYSVQNIIVVPGVDLIAGPPVPSAFVAADWGAKMWKSIAPFVWEPVVALYPLRSVALFLSVPNLLLAFSLGGLVGLNVSVAVARTRAARAAGGQARSVRGILASAPGLLTGFTCCVPTAVLALGSLAAGLTVAVIAVRPYLIPLAAIALTANLVWGFRRLRCQIVGASDASGRMEGQPRAGR